MKVLHFLNTNVQQQDDFRHSNLNFFEICIENFIIYYLIMSASVSVKIQPSFLFTQENITKEIKLV